MYPARQNSSKVRKTILSGTDTFAHILWWYQSPYTAKAFDSPNVLYNTSNQQSNIKYLDCK